MPKREYPVGWERGAVKQKLEAHDIKPISDEHRLLLGDVDMLFKRIKAMRKSLRKGKANKVLVDDAVEAWRMMATALMAIRKPELDGTEN